MSCHVCSRGHSSQLPLFCSTCARNQLYPLRLDNARMLLEKEATGRQVEAAVTGENAQDKRTDTNEILDGLERKPTTRWAVQAALTETALSSARTKSTLAHIDMLRKEIKEKRNEVSRRKAILTQRRSDAESANYQLPERRDAALTSVQNSIKRTEHLWHALHNKTAESRIFLCREAASVYGLRQKLRKKNSETKEVYVIGGVTIVDLREMNGTLREPRLSF
jgi:Vacuolar sorting 38 and autophagy-related subunit 14